MVKRELSKLILTPLDWASYLMSAGWQRQPRYSEKYLLRTQDDWQLSLYRIRPKVRKFKTPVLLQHGLGACHRAYNFPERSLARFLSKAGFDVWLSDLRGRLKSQYVAPKVRPTWSVDQYVDEDLPTFLNFVKQQTHSPKVNVIGHSLGGVLIYMFGVRHGTSDMQAAVTTAASLDYTQGESRFKKLLSLQPLVERLATVPYGSLARLFSFAVGRVPNNLEHFSYNRSNMPGWLARQWYATVFQNISPDVLLSLAKTFATSGFCHSDGYVYNQHCENFRAPLLALAGTADQQCRPEAVRSTFERLGSSRKKIRVFGEQAEEPRYGHADILVGDRVDQFVWPEIQGWLEQQQPENS